MATRRTTTTIDLTVNEKLLDRAIRHAHFLERLKTGEANRILARLNRTLYPRIAAEIGKLDDIGIETWGGRMRQSKRLTRMRHRLANLIDEEIRSAADILNISLDKIAGVESSWAIQAISQEMPVAVRLDLPSPNQLSAIRRSQPFRGKLLKNWYKALETSTKNQVSNAINTGIADGSSIPDIVRSLKGTRAAGFSDGILAQSRREVTTIVRTAVTHVTARARDMAYAQNSDVVKAVQWVSTLDDRTTEICGDLDGETDPGKLGGQRPPAHFNCRSTTSPVLRSFKEMGFAIEEPPPGTRAARNLRTGVTGKVPATTTYVEWLKRQSPADVRRILGPTKAEAWLSGRITFDKFVKNGRPLTVGQLKDLDLI